MIKKRGVGGAIQRNERNTLASSWEEALAKTGSSNRGNRKRKCGNQFLHPNYGKKKRGVPSGRREGGKAPSGKKGYSRPWVEVIKDQCRSR